MDRIPVIRHHKATHILGFEGGLWKLPGQRPVLPGKEMSFLLCPLDPAYTEAGIPGHLPATRSGSEANPFLMKRPKGRASGRCKDGYRVGFLSDQRPADLPVNSGLRPTLE